MPTQIQATPIIKGKEARKIWEESQREMSEKAKQGEEKIRQLFERKEKRKRINILVKENKR